MAYVTVQEVQYFINTEVSSTDITNMITLADAELDIMLGGSSMSGNVKTACSARIVAMMLAQRDPETYTVGSSQTNFGRQITRWDKYVKARVREAKIDTVRG